ncbi:MAG: hypothetical protein M3361_20475 [Candidatus Tectomicrobia bacterium]|nr:hypothetical protein [Candidatus Tectomicrobia bacterium]
MAQESRKVIVKKLGAPGTVEVDLLPSYTARDVLRRIGASDGMILSPAPQMGLVFDPDEEVFDGVVSGQTLFAGLPTPVGR